MSAWSENASKGQTWKDDHGWQNNNSAWNANSTTGSAPTAQPWEERSPQPSSSWDEAKPAHKGWEGWEERPSDNSGWEDRSHAASSTWEGNTRDNPPKMTTYTHADHSEWKSWDNPITPDAAWHPPAIPPTPPPAEQAYAKGTGKGEGKPWSETARRRLEAPEDPRFGKGKERQEQALANDMAEHKGKLSAKGKGEDHAKGKHKEGKGKGPETIALVMPDSWQCINCKDWNFKDCSRCHCFMESKTAKGIGIVIGTRNKGGSVKGKQSQGKPPKGKNDGKSIFIKGGKERTSIATDKFGSSYYEFKNPQTGRWEKCVTH